MLIRLVCDRTGGDSARITAAESLYLLKAISNSFAPKKKKMLKFVDAIMQLN
jgi:hypothetical protein